MSHLDQLAPFAILRLAGLPYACLEALRLPASERLLDALMASEAAMQAVAPALDEALHQAVAALAEDDRVRRRRLLALKRDIFNGRTSRLSLAEFDEIQAWVPEGMRPALRQWWLAQQDWSRDRAALDESLPSETASRLRPALRAVLRDPGFKRGLSFASQGMEQAAQRERVLPKGAGPDNYERSLLAYLGRAAAKTSPFSSFMGMAVLPIGDQAAALPAVPEPQLVSHMRLNRGMLARLARAAGPELARSHTALLKLNPTLQRLPDGRLRALCDRDIVVVGRPWLEQRLAVFRLAPALAAALLDGDRETTWAQWLSRLASGGVPPDQAPGMLLKLLERGVLMLPPEFDAYTEAPDLALMRRWQSSESHPLRALADELQAMGATVQALAQAGDSGLSQEVASLREGEQRVLTALGSTGAEPLQNLLLEDCWQTGAVGDVGGDLTAPLADLADFLSTQVVMSPYYRRLRDAFVGLYGVGGSCSDVLDFLQRSGDKLIDLPEFGAKLQADVLEAAPAGTRLVVTAQLQMGQTPQGMQGVVNRVFDRAGWLAARFTAGEGEQQRQLQNHLRHWLVQLSGDAEPVDVPIAGHCNDLQAHRPLTRRVLCWPGEPVLLPGDQCLTLDQLRIHHDAPSGLLQVQDTTGRALRLFYLGSTFPNPAWGLRFALAVLTEPWQLGRPDFAPPPVEDAPIASGLRQQARLTHGRVVVRRATWWMTRDHASQHWFDAATWPERLLAIRRDAQRHGLPECFYAQRQIDTVAGPFVTREAAGSDHKPVWINRNNPFCLALLERMFQDCTSIALTEALPSGEALWLQVQGQAHVSELQFELAITAAGAPAATS